MSEAVFVDTSAVFALLSKTDRAHTEAGARFQRLAAERVPLVTSSYVLVECYALLQRRLGREAVTAFRERFAPLLDVVWVDVDAHEAGLDVLLNEAGGLSLVDAVSFEIMRARSIARAFAFDRHFEERGHTLDR